MSCRRAHIALVATAALTTLLAAGPLGAASVTIEYRGPTVTEDWGAVNLRLAGEGVLPTTRALGNGRTYCGIYQQRFQLGGCPQSVARLAATINGVVPRKLNPGSSILLPAATVERMSYDRRLPIATRADQRRAADVRTALRPHLISATTDGSSGDATLVLQVKGLRQEFAGLTAEHAKALAAAVERTGRADVTVAVGDLPPEPPVAGTPPVPPLPEPVVATLAPTTTLPPPTPVSSPVAAPITAVQVSAPRLEINPAMAEEPRDTGLTINEPRADWTDLMLASAHAATLHRNFPIGDPRPVNSSADDSSAQTDRASGGALPWILVGLGMLVVGQGAGFSPPLLAAYAGAALFLGSEAARWTFSLADVEQATGFYGLQLLGLLVMLLAPTLGRIIAAVRRGRESAGADQETGAATGSARRHAHAATPRPSRTGPIAAATESAIDPETEAVPATAITPATAHALGAMQQRRSGLETLVNLRPVPGPARA